MILADKIINLRKKNGLSQEELAEKMNVSRQSVSKWEGAQSVPDLNKIIMLSEIFGVSTDYLLKDEIDEPEFTVREDSDSEPPMRQVSMEEANEFLEENKRFSKAVSLGVFICILSVIPTLILGAVSEIRSNDAYAAAGAGVMLCMIAFAVMLFIKSGTRAARFDYLAKEPIDTAYGVEGMAKEKREQLRPKHSSAIATGVVLCILGVAAMIVLAVFGEKADWFGKNTETILGCIGVCVMLVMIAIGVYIIVKPSIIMDGYKKLLEDEDYSRRKKIEENETVNVVMIFWMFVTAAYLATSFIFDCWKWSWVIFAVGGVLTPAVREIAKAAKKK